MPLCRINKLYHNSKNIPLDGIDVGHTQLSLLTFFYINIL